MDRARFRQTDYTAQVRPRSRAHQAAMSGFVAQPANHAPTPKPQVKTSRDEPVVISIRINLPDYNQWRITHFVRQYPYLSIAIAIISVILLLLAIQALLAAWHSSHIHQLPPAVIYRARGS